VVAPNYKKPFISADSIEKAAMRHYSKKSKRLHQKDAASFTKIVYSLHFYLKG